MTLEAYWLIVPLLGIGLSGFGWLALWIARQREKSSQPQVTMKPLRRVRED
jgi:hypothetical protein